LSKKNSPRLFAVIHIGSEQVTLQISEYNNLDDLHVVERTSREVFLGEETFKTGQISFATSSQLCTLLKGYKRLMNEYGVKDYRILATTALREAENQHYIVDQIHIRTGLQVEVIDMLQEIFFKYAALYHIIRKNQIEQTADALLFVDISSGGLGFTLLKNGIIHYQQNIHIGALRIKESFDKNQRESIHFHQALSEYIFSSIETVKTDLACHKIKYIVTSGNEDHLLLQMLGRTTTEMLTLVSRNEFHALYEKVQNLNLPQLMKSFRLVESKAEMVLPTIVLYNQILSITNAPEILFPDAQLVDGVTLLHAAEKVEDSFIKTLSDQTLSLARNLGNKYRYELAHAEAVEMLSLKIFDAMNPLHGLPDRDRFLLQVASILHDIGKYVNLRRHYFFSYRLILSSDIIGFTEREKEVIANIAHYHSKGTPSDLDGNFARLNRDEKVKVAKLASMIRLADSIDRSHKQKVASCDIRLREDTLEVCVSPLDDFSLEQWTFADKADFFENVHGVRPVLINQAGGNYGV
jgi:exopolyphosphatase/guanosine-5'-triphosphate,3'-diphosphate pyrophosphatase